MSGSNELADGEESFAAMFEESLKTEDLKEGDIVKGKVIAVGSETVIVDIGYKSEGAIQVSEFIDSEGKVAVAVGDQIDVFLESRENEDGLCVLSKEKADRLKVWDEISAACERDELIEGTIRHRGVARGTGRRARGAYPWLRAQFRDGRPDRSSGNAARRSRAVR
jgi:small subunit ribosomal protein S1